MVGVAGGSKACDPCKRRRKGCDQKRPRCQRCVQSGLECGYGEQTRVIMYHHQDTRQLRTKSAAPKVVALPAPLFASARSCAYMDAAWRSLNATGASIPYWWAQLPEIPAVYTNDTALHSAFTALSLAVIGQQTCDKDVSQQGARAYQRALFRVQRELNSTSRGVSENLIATVLVLAGFETIQGSPEGRYVSVLAHHYGAIELAKRYAQSSPQLSRAGYMILSDVRENAVLGALGNRMPVSETVRSWCKASPHRSQIDDLMDIAADVPTFLHSFDLAKSLPRDQLSVQHVVALHDEVEDIVQRLLRWRVDVTPQITHQLEPSRILDGATSLETKGMHPQRRQYLSLHGAKMEIIYSTVQMAVGLERLSLARFTASCRPASDTDPEWPSDRVDTLEIIQEVNFHAETILASLEYYMHDQVGILAILPNIGSLVLLIVFFQMMMNDPRARLVWSIVRDFQHRTAVPLVDLVQEAVERACESMATS